MNVTRKGAAVAAVVVGSLALTACGSDNNSGSATTGSSNSPSASAAAVKCFSGSLQGEGSTAQKNAIEQVIADYVAKCSGATINYNPTGSGAGIKQFNAAQVDWAGSDSALNATNGEVAAAATRCAGNPAWNIPMVAGPIAVSTNIDGVKDLTLSADVAAKIFKGTISKWNDPAIADLNKDAKLPDTAIKVFFRSDSSGTTANFTAWMNAAAATSWADAPSKTWSGTGEGKQGSAGVTQAVQATPGSIGYLEWSYAKDAKLTISKIDNGGGAVELTGDAVGKTIATATQVGTGNDLSLKIDYATKEKGAYPIVLVTYEIACSKGLDATKAEGLKDFLSFFASADEQKSLVDIGYAPLPAAISEKVSTAIQAIA